MRSLAITSLATAVALSALTLAACATSEPEGAASPQDTVLSPESKSDDGGDDAGGSTILPLMDSQPGPVDVGAETLDVVGAPDGLNLDALPETAKEDADAILEQELPESDSADVSDGAPGPEPDPETPCVGQLDGQPCTDEDPCTTDDVCLEEQCIGGLPLECDDLLACNGTETCEDDLGCMSGLPLECDDQDACNGTETCEDDLGCLPGQPLDCDDGVDCTVDSCAEDGACQHAPLPPGASSCETDWATISEELLTKLDLLPSPPMEALPMSWSTHVPQLRHDRLEGGPASQGWAPDTSACDAGLWDPERIATGSAYSLAGQEHCYVTAEPTSFEFRNREGSSYSQPISGEPAWVQARFPVPPGHEIKRLDIHLHYPRLFGSHPEGCHSAEQDEQGSCVLNKDSAWESVPPGFYLLWSQPGAAGHAITGPHLPTVDKLLWWDVVVTPEIPEALLGAQELVVTLLVYRQYPGGCVEQNGQQSCINGKGMKSSLALDAMMLETRATSLSEELPALGHPRVNGDTETWLASQAPFEALPCETLTNAADQVGGLANIKDVWDLRTLGARPCLGEAIPSLIDHPDTGPYVNPPDAEDAEAWAPSTASRERALHAIRRTKACLQGPTPETCHTTDEELAEVIEAYKLYELTHMDSWTWCAGGFCSFGFDLWTAPTVMFWARFVDALWDELNEEEHALILAKTGERIDMYLDLFEDRHWAIFNGNNWTPKLAAGALAWAIAYYYEDPRAPQVAILAMGSMWWHRSFWKADGAYEEGATYGFYSLLPAMQVVHLYDASFGGGVHSIAWEHLAETADWYMDVMSPDGSLLDFGDGHAKYGWDTLTPLYAALAPEWGQQQPTEIDPCLARDYWAFKYWNHGLEDPWFLDPVMARDWKSLIAQCDASPPAQSVRTYPLGGWSFLQTHTPGISGITGDLDPGSKLRDADSTLLAASTVSNEYEHMEADFGTLIWAAYGSRLLADIGYGTQAKDLYTTEVTAADVLYEAVDNNAVGHTTLMIPEAVHPLAESASNTSQVEGAHGTTQEGSWGDVSGVHLDGSHVYGKVGGNPAWEEAQALGWLEAFDRWLLMLPGGHFLVADSFLVREDRPDITATETWQFYPPTDEATSPICKHKVRSVDVSLETPNVLRLEPRCSLLLKSADTEVVGQILAASDAPGSFVEPEVFSNYVNNGGTLQHQRARYAPDSPLRHDARVFALLAAPNASALPEATLEAVACGEDACFELIIDGELTSIHFTWNGERHVLSTVTLP